MTGPELAVRIGGWLALALIPAIWKIVVVYRVTSKRYIYRSRGRWGETEIRPADLGPNGT